MIQTVLQGHEAIKFVDSEKQRKGEWGNGMNFGTYTQFAVLRPKTRRRDVTVNPNKFLFFFKLTPQKR
jgi:beta-galactosidase beta subunit